MLLMILGLGFYSMMEVSIHGHILMCKLKRKLTHILTSPVLFVVDSISIKDWTNEMEANVYFIKGKKQGLIDGIFHKNKVYHDKINRVEIVIYKISNN